MRGLAASPLGFLIGLSLGALGGGGSILAVPVLVYAAGQDPQQATATSLLLVGSAALVGMVAHHRAGRVQVRVGLLFGLAGVGGSFAGSMLNRRVDPDVLLLGFSLLMLVAVWRMLTACPSCTNLGEQRALRESGTSVVAVRSRLDVISVAKLVAAGTFVGFLTGLFGVGGGFVIVPALTLLLGFSMPDAIGTSLLVIAINSGLALVMRLGSSTVEWSVAVPFTVAAIAGVLTGKHLHDRLDPARSLRWFAALLLAVACYTGAQSLIALAS